MRYLLTLMTLAVLGCCGPTPEEQYHTALQILDRELEKQQMFQEGYDAATVLVNRLEDRNPKRAGLLKDQQRMKEKLEKQKRRVQRARELFREADERLE